MRNTMSKKALSTFEREMQDIKFKNEFEAGYQKLVLSELLTAIMLQNDKSVRELAKE
jgi:hypothetical protein